MRKRQKKPFHFVVDVYSGIFYLNWFSNRVELISAHFIQISWFHWIVSFSETIWKHNWRLLVQFLKRNWNLLIVSGLKKTVFCLNLSGKLGLYLIRFSMNSSIWQKFHNSAEFPNLVEKQGKWNFFKITNDKLL